MRAVAPIVYEPVTAFPSSPTKGMTVVLNSDGVLYTYNGTSWVAAGGGGGGGLSEYQVRRRVLWLR